ncbi:hypothetical protein [Trueperella pyogenes]
MDLIRVFEELLPDVDIFDSDATGAATYPYVLVLSTTNDRGREAVISGEGVADRVIVRVVGVQAEQARRLLLWVRKQLGSLNLTRDGVNLQMRFAGSPRPPQVDRTIMLENSNTNPVFIDDEYEAYWQGEQSCL